MSTGNFVFFRDWKHRIPLVPYGQPGNRMGHPNVGVVFKFPHHLGLQGPIELKKQVETGMKESPNVHLWTAAITEDQLYSSHWVLINSGFRLIDNGINTNTDNRIFLYIKSNNLVHTNFVPEDFKDDAKYLEVPGIGVSYYYGCCGVYIRCDYQSEDSCLHDVENDDLSSEGIDVAFLSPSRHFRLKDSLHKVDWTYHGCSYDKETPEKSVFIYTKNNEGEPDFPIDFFEPSAIEGKPMGWL